MRLEIHELGRLTSSELGFAFAPKKNRWYTEYGHPASRERMRLEIHEFGRLTSGELGESFAFAPRNKTLAFKALGLG